MESISFTNKSVLVKIKSLRGLEEPKAGVFIAFYFQHMYWRNKKSTENI